MALLLSACAATPSSPTPTQEPFPRLVTSPALAPWLQEWTAAYRDAVGPPEFQIELLPPAAALNAVETGEATAAILGQPPPDGWFATPLGWEPIIVVTHPGVPIRDLTLRDLADIFSGRLDVWTQLGGPSLAVVPVIPLEGDEIRALLIEAAPASLPVTGSALLAPSPAQGRKLIQETAGAIGLLPWSSLADAVDGVRVDGALPPESPVGASRYPLLLEVVAMAPEPPDGAVRGFLAWIQSQLGP